MGSLSWELLGKCKPTEQYDELIFIFYLQRVIIGNKHIMKSGLLRKFYKSVFPFSDTIQFRNAKYRPIRPIKMQLEHAAIPRSIIMKDQLIYIPHINMLQPEIRFVTCYENGVIAFNNCIEK